MRPLTGDRRLLRNAAAGAAANGLLDAAALGASSRRSAATPSRLFAAYGIANVRADPGDPGRWGIVDATTPALLVGFGLPKHIATLGVLGWRLVNYWLPIPTSAIAYLTLQRPRRRHDQDASRRAPGDGEVPRHTGCRGG